MATALPRSVSVATKMISVAPAEGDPAGERSDELLRQYSCSAPTVEELQVFDSSHHNLQWWEKRKSKSEEPWWRKNEMNGMNRTGLGEKKDDKERVSSPTYNGYHSVMPYTPTAVAMMM